LRAEISGGTDEDQRLPVVHINGMNYRQLNRKRNRRVDRAIMRPVGVRPLRKVAELIGFIVMAKFQNGCAGDVLDSRGRFNVCGIVA